MTFEPGWKCPNCYTGNEHGWDSCDNCGADRDGEVPLQRRVANIQGAAHDLDQISTEDTIDLDKALGEIEGLVREARQSIDKQWRRLRERAERPTINSAELDQILKDVLE